MSVVAAFRNSTKDIFQKGIKEGIESLLSPGYIDHYKDLRENLGINTNDNQRSVADQYLEKIGVANLEQNLNQYNTLDDICNAVGANKDSVKAFLSRIFFGIFTYRDPERHQDTICEKLYRNPEKYGRKIGKEMVSHDPKVVAKAAVAYLWLLKVCY